MKNIIFFFLFFLPIFGFCQSSSIDKVEASILQIQNEYEFSPIEYKSENIELMPLKWAEGLYCDSLLSGIDNILSLRAFIKYIDIDNRMLINFDIYKFNNQLSSFKSMHLLNLISCLAIYENDMALADAISNYYFLFDDCIICIQNIDHDKFFFEKIFKKIIEALKP